ncbi:sialate O-acetylesterase [bacterium]|nr:sialate O-acetylesterase [bacterium]
MPLFNIRTTFAVIVFIFPALISIQTVSGRGPLKVFILAGQSNMEGHAKLETFDYLADDPKTAPILKKMRDAEGKPHICDGAWISYLTGVGDNNGEGYGRLTAGYGSRRNPAESGGKIGPEFTFGITMDDAFEEDVLVIKTAWGGKSLFYDYRPPSAEPYQQSANDRERDRNTPENAGHYYRLMIEHVKFVLSDIARICPNYDSAQGYEIAGFVWFQGFNDMVNRNVYPETADDNSTNRFETYTQNLGHLIRDVRTELGTPDLPVVIGVMGVGGKNPNEKNAAFRNAMAATADIPDLKGLVTPIQTAEFWDAALAAIDDKRGKIRQMRYLLRTENKNHANKDGDMTPQQQNDFVTKYESELITAAERAQWERGASNAGYHYLGCAKTFAVMGEAFANAILEQRQN